MLLRKKEDARAVLFRRPLCESQDENTDGDITFLSVHYKCLGGGLSGQMEAECGPFHYHG